MEAAVFFVLQFFCSFGVRTDPCDTSSRRKFPSRSAVVGHTGHRFWISSHLFWPAVSTANVSQAESCFARWGWARGGCRWAELAENQLVVANDLTSLFVLGMVLGKTSASRVYLFARSVIVDDAGARTHLLGCPSSEKFGMARLHWRDVQTVLIGIVDYSMPSLSPGSRLTRFCSQLLRSFDASRC